MSTQRSASSPELDAEEWAIHGCDEFGGVFLSESEDIETVVAMAQFIAEHGELNAEVLEHAGSNIDEAKRLLLVNYD